jgi:hypothetical protein
MSFYLFVPLLFSFLFAESKEATLKPLLSDEKIKSVVAELKKQKQIPEIAIDKVFDFYKNNRKSVGGLKDRACIDKKEYKIRAQDGKQSKKDLHEGILNETCVCVADFTRAKTEKRGFCVLLNKDGIEKVENFPLAHGSGSIEKAGRPTTFTNKLTKTGTTLSGMHITAKSTSVFGGKDQSKPYTSMGLSLYGLEASNWTATAVGKVTHGAPYVKDLPVVSAGHSLGCPAMPMETARRVLPLCKGQAAWYNYTLDDELEKITEMRSCADKKL